MFGGEVITPSLVTVRDEAANPQSTNEILITHRQRQWFGICVVLLPPQETVGGRSSRLEATDYWDCVGTLVKN